MSYKINEIGTAERHAVSKKDFSSPKTTLVNVFEKYKIMNVGNPLSAVCRAVGKAPAHGGAIANCKLS